MFSSRFDIFPIGICQYQLLTKCSYQEAVLFVRNALHFSFSFQLRLFLTTIQGNPPSDNRIISNTHPQARISPPPHPPTFNNQPDVCVRHAPGIHRCCWSQPCSTYNPGNNNSEFPWIVPKFSDIKKRLAFDSGKNREAQNWKRPY